MLTARRSPDSLLTDQSRTAAVPHAVEEWMRTARIVVVDDNPNNVAILQRLLARNGYEGVTTTTDPYEAVALCESHDPDLVLLDLHMPTLDGFGVLEQLRDRLLSDDYLPVVVLTGDPSPETKHRALQDGAADFLTKPFDHAEALLRVRNLLRTRYLQVQLSSRKAFLELEVGQRTHDLQAARVEVVDRLALAAEYRDDETHQHTQRVSETCVLIAHGLHMGDAYIDMLRRAAPLHDIGKIGISDSILLKPGKLTPEEYESMKSHTSIGAKILSGSNVAFLALGEEIALTHHERWDGGGYPKGLSRDEIPLSGRIVAIADVFDALTNERPYKPAWGIDEALEEMQQLRGKHFDPAVFDAFAGAFSPASMGAFFF